MSNVRANPQQLRNLKHTIQRSRKEIDQAVRNIQAGLTNASDWNDQVRKRFENDLRIALAGFKKFDQDADQLCNHLERKARQLDDFLR
ncbi:MAG: hypothetical protein Q4A92_04085 [Corynebacterium sp.]|nr:hypothetical protein [Corynebacterium sp.]